MLTPVIPIASGKKGPPFVKDWPHASLEALEEAMEKYPGCNLALRLDRYLALDPDDQEAAGFLVKLEREGKLPPTVAWQTWRGMTIRLYRRPNGLEPVKPNGSGMKLEIRTSPGQYVLIPDSIINGKKYRWLPDVGPADIEVAELPSATLNFIRGVLARHVEAKPTSSTSASPWAELWQGLPKGSRNDAAAKLAGRLLGRGITGDEALEILRAWNANNHPPLSEAELVRTLQSITKAEERKGKKDDTPTVLIATQLLARTLQRPPEIIGEGIFPEGTGTIAVNVGTPTLIEVHYKPHDTAGVFQVRVGGVLDINFSGDTTDGATAIDGIRIGGDGNYYASCWFDNVVIDNAAWPGDTRIQAIRSSAPGALAEWDPSAGQNWDCVDEIPYSDTDYVSTNVTGKTDLYEVTDLVGSIHSVKCVQVTARAIKEGSPTPQNLQLACRSGGANYFGENVPVPAVNPKPLTKLWDTNPATGQPWTKDEVNALQFGFKAVA